jgi:hypothetical protein
MRIAATVADRQQRTLLIDMAQAWLRLADQATKNLSTDLVYETPPARTTHAAPTVQQQQQVQPKQPPESDD